MDTTSPHQLDGLLANLCDGDLSPEEQARLSAALAESDSALESYVRYVSLHAWLRQRYGRLSPDDQHTIDTVDRAARTTAGHTEPHNAGGEGRSGAWQPTRNSGPSGRLRGRSAAWWAASVLPVVGVGLALVLVLSLGVRRQWVDPPWAALPRGSRPLVGVVVGTHECQWGPADSGTGLGSIVREGDIIDLVAGTVEMIYDSGTRVVLHGRTRLRTTSSDECSLEAGEMVARLAPDVRQFAVTVGDVRIVDRGTEFGVRRLVAHHVDLQVFDGEIAVFDTSSRRANGGLTLLGSLRAGDTASVILEQGHRASEMQRQLPLSEEFVRTLPTDARRTDVSSSQRPGDGVESRLVAMDGFCRLPEGKCLADVTSGIGWSAPWSDDTVSPSAVLKGMTDVVVVDGCASNNGQGNAGIHRALPIAMNRSTPVYASATFRITGRDPSCAAWVLLFKQTTGRNWGEGQIMEFGISSGRYSARLAFPDADVGHSAESKRTGDFGRYLPGETVQIIVRLEFDAEGGQERLSAWVNPSVSGQQSDVPPAPDHVVTRETGRNEVDAAAIRFWNMDKGTAGFVGDLRIGTSWKSVAE